MGKQLGQGDIDALFCGCRGERLGDISRTGQRDFSRAI